VARVPRGLDGVELAELFDRSRRPMMVSDDDRRYVDVNPAACELLDLTRAEILARRIDDFASAERRKALPSAWRELLRVGENAGVFEFALPTGLRVRAAYSSVAHVGPRRHLTILLSASVVDSGAPERRRLSPREVEVLRLLADGSDGPQVAAALVLSPATVRTHVNNAMRKLDARTRAHAVAVALRDGLI
jgi:DNA-binding CsgD family transcriptional regulator